MTPPERIDERAKMLRARWRVPLSAWETERLSLQECWRRLARLTFKLEMEAKVAETWSTAVCSSVESKEREEAIRAEYAGLLPEEPKA